MRLLAKPVSSPISFLVLIALLAAILGFVGLFATTHEIPGVSRVVCEITGGDWKDGEFMAGCFDTPD
jgi:uncharacterized membrane protein YtjA (UPF0391 family)